MAKNGITTSYDDAGYPASAAFTTPVAAGVASVAIKNSPGRLLKIVVTASGTSSDNLTIYDNNSAGSGTVLAVIPGGTTLGTVVDVNLPAVNGIYAVNVASGPAVTIGWA